MFTHNGHFNHRDLFQVLSNYWMKCSASFVSTLGNNFRVSGPDHVKRQWLVECTKATPEPSITKTSHQWKLAYTNNSCLNFSHCFSTTSAVARSIDSCFNTIGYDLLLLYVLSDSSSCSVCTSQSQTISLHLFTAHLPEPPSQYGLLFRSYVRWLWSWCVCMDVRVLF